jgi:hypothetical protein
VRQPLQDLDQGCRRHRVSTIQQRAHDASGHRTPRASLLTRRSEHLRSRNRVPRARASRKRVDVDRFIG